MFEDREDAGRLLAEALSNQNPDVDIVLLTSIDAFPIGKKIASELEVPLNSIISQDLTVPGKKLSFGAVSERGTLWVDDATRREFMIGGKYISNIREVRSEKIQETLERLGLDQKPDLQSKNIVLVSSGITTGIKEAASLGAALRGGSSRRMMVSPSISEAGLERMGLADEVICLERTSFALSSNEFYSDKHSIKPDEIKSYFRA